MRVRTCLDRLLFTHSFYGASHCIGGVKGLRRVLKLETSRAWRRWTRGRCNDIESWVRRLADEEGLPILQRDEQLDYLDDSDDPLPGEPGLRGVFFTPQGYKGRPFYRLVIDDPELGRVSVVIMVGWSFDVSVVANGHEVLYRILATSDIEFQAAGNTVTGGNDWDEITLLSGLVTQTAWESHLCRLLRTWARPLMPLIARTGYQWAMRQTEIATDLVFADEGLAGDFFTALASVACVILGAAPADSFYLAISYGRIRIYRKTENVVRIETLVRNPDKLRGAREVNKRDGTQVMELTYLRKNPKDIHAVALAARQSNQTMIGAAVGWHVADHAAARPARPERRMPRKFLRVLLRTGIECGLVGFTRKRLLARASERAKARQHPEMASKFLTQLVTAERLAKLGRQTYAIPVVAMVPLVAALRR